MRTILLTFCTLISIGAFSQNTTLSFGNYRPGDTALYANIVNITQVEFTDSNGMIDSAYHIYGGIVVVDAVPGMGRIMKGGILDDKSTSLVSVSKGKQVTLVVDYLDPNGHKRKAGLSFLVE